VLAEVRRGEVRRGECWGGTMREKARGGDVRRGEESGDGARGVTRRGTGSGDPASSARGSRRTSSHAELPSVLVRFSETQLWSQLWWSVPHRALAQLPSLWSLPLEAAASGVLKWVRAGGTKPAERRGDWDERAECGERCTAGSPCSPWRRGDVGGE